MRRIFAKRIVKAHTWDWCWVRCGKRIEPGERYWFAAVYRKYHLHCLPEDMKPKRIQRKRIKDWRMPPNTVYVGRPSIFSNPFKIGKDNGHENLYAKDAKEAVKLFKEYSSLCSYNSHIVKERLIGKNLACWCPLDQPCHADVLLEIANS